MEKRRGRPPVELRFIYRMRRHTAEGKSPLEAARLVIQDTPELEGQDARMARRYRTLEDRGELPEEEPIAEVEITLIRQAMEEQRVLRTQYQAELDALAERATRHGVEIWTHLEDIEGTIVQIHNHLHGLRHNAYDHRSLVEIGRRARTEEAAVEEIRSRRELVEKAETELEILREAVRIRRMLYRLGES